MLLIEISHPTGALNDADRDALGQSIVDLFLASDGHAEETLRRARTATHIAFRELTGWRTGHGLPADDHAPPMIIDLSVPEIWHEAYSTFIGLLRTAVRRLDDDRGWERARGSLWVRVNGVRDGAFGLDGRPATGEDVLDFMTEDFRAARASGTAAPAPVGKLIDPICGMAVTDGKGTLTVTHDGVRVGFCASACRDAYLGEHPAAVA